MNIRKPADYTALYAALDWILAKADGLTQMELSRLIGQAIATRSEKGAAVAASEYIQQNHPELSGFSPRTLRRMRDFYRAYENDQKLMAKAMQLNWSCNIVILEACESQDDRRRHIHAALRHGWSKSQLTTAIAEGLCNETSLELEDENFVEENCNGTTPNPDDGILPVKYTYKVTTHAEATHAEAPRAEAVHTETICAEIIRAKITHTEIVHTKSLAANSTAPVVPNISPNSGHPAAPLAVNQLDNAAARIRSYRNKCNDTVLYHWIPPLVRLPHTALRHDDLSWHRWETTQSAITISEKPFNSMNCQFQGADTKSERDSAGKPVLRTRPKPSHVHPLVFHSSPLILSLRWSIIKTKEMTQGGMLHGRR